MNKIEVGKKVKSNLTQAAREIQFNFSHDEVTEIAPTVIDHE